MKAVYRTVSALLAIGSGFLIAVLVSELVKDRDIVLGWFVVFAIVALLAAGAAVVLWARAIDRR